MQLLDGQAEHTLFASEYPYRTVRENDKSSEDVGEEWNHVYIYMGVFFFCISPISSGP